MNKIAIFFIILTIVTSCNRSKKVDKKVIETIDISEIFKLEAESKYLSEFVSDFEYIRPEAKPGSYFSMMGISYIGPEFIILSEKTTSQLYAFHRNGHFIGELGKRGPGPDEYLTPQEVNVLTDIEEIHVSDFKRNRILRYGFDLKYIGEVKLNPVPVTMHIYKNKYYLCAYSDNDIRENGGDDLIMRDPISLKELKVLWKRNDITSFQTSDIGYIKNGWFLENQDTLYYARKISNSFNIYKISNDKLELTFILHDNSTKTENQFEMTAFLNHIMFFNDYLILGFQKNDQTYTGYYNLETRDLSNFRIINDFDKGPDFYPMGISADKGYYSDDLKLQYFTEFWNSKISSSSYTNLKSKFPERENWLRETIPNSQEDNPWIMIVYPD